MNHEYKKKIAGWLIIVVGLILFYGSLPYLTGFFGALILFVIFSPLYNYLSKHIGKRPSALLTIFVSLIVLILPLSIIITVMFNEVGQLINNREEIMEYINQLDYLFPGFELSEFTKDQIPKVVGTAQTMLVTFLKGFTSSIINILIMYFILFYLFISKDTFYKKALEFIPFNRKNADKLIIEFKEITNSTILTSGLIAVIQGALITVGFLFFGLEGAFLWGFVAFLSSFLPFVGAAIVWVPTSLLALLQGDYFVAIGMFIWGVFISTIDNVIRPFIQNKIRPVHPLIIFIGVFIGLPLFGMLGIFIGPLLISYFLLTTEMFVKEYIEPGRKTK